MMQDRGHLLPEQRNQRSMSIDRMSTEEAFDLIYENLMVDLDSWACNKLVDRSTRIIMQVAGVDRPTAPGLLREARGRVKTAIVMHLRQADRESAERWLNEHGGNVRAVMEVTAAE